MPAYILVSATVHDPEAFGPYAQRAAELTAQFGGKYIVPGTHTEILEGESGYQAALVSEWPSLEAAKAFWNSPEYTEARKLREGLADVQVLLVDGAP